MNKLVLAADQGVVIYERVDDDWKEAGRGLKNEDATSVTIQAGVVLAGTTDGIFRFDTERQTWERASNGLSTLHVRWLTFHPEVPNLVFAGTEPANIFISHDAGSSWRQRPEVAQLRDKFKWYLPYSPEAGCVRGFAFHGSRAYAAVEVGGVLVSNDNGETWQLAEGSNGEPDLKGPPEPFVYPDVHSLEVHGSSPELVYAPTGGGFYRSYDGGKTWKLFYDCYCRAVWVDPRNADHVILGPADGVGKNGRIEESLDGGQTWSPASKGLNVPWRHAMVERFIQSDDELLAILSNGHLLRAALSSLEWQRILPGITGVNAIAT